MDILSSIGTTMIKGDVEQLKELINEAQNQGYEQQVIINDGLIASMMELGEKFKDNQVFIPEVLVAAGAMKEAINSLGFENVSDTTKPKGTVIIGTVRHDMHDIGKNLVALMLKSGGFKVYDLGIDVQPETFIESVRRIKPDLVALSALLTTTMEEMKIVIEALEKEGVRDDVCILVGGAPVTNEYASSIGADGFAGDAVSAVSKAIELIES